MSLFVPLLGAVCLIACGMEDKADDAVARLNVDKVMWTLSKTGVLNNGTVATFQVVANKGFTITSEESWLKVDKTEGRGTVDVQILADENNTMGNRTGKLLVKSQALTEEIVVMQTLETPTDEAKLRVFYEENFDWLKPFSQINSDPVEAKNGNTRTRMSNATLVDKWKACGLINWNPTKDCISAYAHYIHFNGNDYFDSGVILPNIDVAAPVNATLTFVSCADGGGPDVVPLVVEIVEGDGSLSIEDTDVKKSEAMYHPNTWKWDAFEVKLYGITKTTKLAIHSATGGKNKYCRWFLDSIKLKEMK